MAIWPKFWSHSTPCSTTTSRKYCINNNTCFFTTLTSWNLTFTPWNPTSTPFYQTSTPFKYTLTTKKQTLTTWKSTLTNWQHTPATWHRPMTTWTKTLTTWRNTLATCTVFYTVFLTTNQNKLIIWQPCLKTCNTLLTARKNTVTRWQNTLTTWQQTVKKWQYTITRWQHTLTTRQSMLPTCTTSFTGFESWIWGCSENQRFEFSVFFTKELEYISLNLLTFCKFPIFLKTFLSFGISLLLCSDRLGKIGKNNFPDWNGIFFVTKNSDLQWEKIVLVI